MEAPRGDAGLSAALAVPAPALGWLGPVAVAAALVAPAAGCGKEEVPRPPSPAERYRDGLGDASRRYDEAAVDAIYEVRDAERDSQRLAGLRRLIAATDRYVERLRALRPPPQTIAAHTDLMTAYAGLARQGRAAERAVRSRGGLAAANEVRRDPATAAFVARARDAEDRLEAAGIKVRSPLQ